MRKGYVILITCIFLVLIFSAFQHCKNNKLYKNPEGYDLNQPQKFVLKQPLHEISGITFLKGSSDTVFAIQDEEGKLFFFHLGSESYEHSKFAGSGDYEDVTIMEERYLVVLKSDGTLFMFTVNQLINKKIDDVRQYKNILPKGEYEGLFGDANGKLIVLCKNCPTVNGKNKILIYTLQYISNEFTISNRLNIDIKTQLKSVKEKRRFHPSCIAQHPLTKEWFIISSVNSVLLILNEEWKPKEIYALNPTLFKQPEGLAFDKEGDMYISNEGGAGSANILVFNYKVESE